jgi:lipopolysaccharide/colanic/teichoic acid biosynthesis glycosyltransferase
MDLVIAGSVLLVSMPALLIVACLILIIDPGPIFFAQVRDGRGGKPIRIYKLRSMIAGAEAKLTQFLAENDDARAEYGRTLKLRNDPRIIPFVGRFIRRMSLDELPQLWSILKGDMSLVGPRVFLKQEVEMYSDEGRALRRDVRPGLTGFWQVEHRSESDLRMREVADSFYVANWSAWLDLWILLRTIRVVSTGAGAF